MLKETKPFVMQFSDDSIAVATASWLNTSAVTSLDCDLATPRHVGTSACGIGVGRKFQQQVITLINSSLKIVSCFPMGGINES